MNESWHYIVFAVSVIAVGYLVSRILLFLMDRFFRKSSVALKVDPTNYNFFRNALRFVILTIVIVIIFYSIPSLKALGLTLLASASLLAIIVGFASQHAFANIVSGLFIVIFKPFRVDDIIEIVGLQVLGYVEDITLRHTVIRSFNNRRYVIPNQIISSETIINSDIKEKAICNFIEIGISYDSDVDKAISIIQEEAEKHPSMIDNRNAEQKSAGAPIIDVRVISFGDSSVNLRAWVWSQDHLAGFRMKTDLLKSIKARFDNEGVEIPFPYRTIVYKNDLEK